MNQAELLDLIELAAQNESTELNLANQAIEYLPPEIGRLSYLVQLDLDGNSFPNVPAEIGNLSRLEVLRLGGNRELKMIPQEVFNLPRLTDLTLPGFETDASSKIGDLRSLEILGFLIGSLKTLPEEIVNCTNLTELYVNFTFLEELPAWIGELINLRKLHLWNLSLEPSNPVAPPPISSIGLDYAGESRRYGMCEQRENWGQKQVALLHLMKRLEIRQLKW